MPDRSFDNKENNLMTTKDTSLSDSSKFVNSNPEKREKKVENNQFPIDKVVPPSIRSSSQRKLKFLDLFRYATLWERILVVFGIFLAALASIGTPFSVVIYGEFTSLLIDRTVGIGTSSPSYVLPLFGGGRLLINATKEENHQAMVEDSIAYGLGSISGALAMLIILAIAVHLVNIVSLKQTKRIRKLFLEAILRQDMSWYETATSGNNFASKITEDVNKMKDGMGEKIAIFVFLVMTFVTGVIASFLYAWKLTLVILVFCPLIIISTALVAKIQSTLTEKELKAYANAGSVAEEVFSSIRTVFAFSGEQKEVERYGKLLKPAEEMGRQKGLYSGIGMGIMWLIIFCSYAVAIWYGVELILADRDNVHREYTTAVLVIVLFCIITGAQNFGFCSPHLEAIATAKGSAKSIFATIDRKSEIDPLDEIGLKPIDITGNIEFEEVHFRYPARSEVEVLKGLNLKVDAGQTVALVGQSGCGKSTALQLMQRLYDPVEGFVKLDGQDIRQLNVGWLRSQIGVVGQEPILFATTIKENIRYGNPNATQEDIEAAARDANCHDFIVKMPQGYDTMVGERGAQMSGGQKQRIAIARALIRNPRILLLDEATSALDPTAERKVQDALEVACKGRTTLVVSHRLSTITNAHSIVFIKDGIVIENGTHNELMARRGYYYDLVQATKRTEEEVERDLSQLSLSKKGSIREKKAASSYAADKESDDDENIDTVYRNEKSLAEKPSKSPKDDKKYQITFRQIMKMNSPEWKFILLGCIAASLHGASFPVWAVLFGDFFGTLSDRNADSVRSQTLDASIMYIGIGIVAGLGSFLQTYMFNKAGTKMTTRLRQKAFKAIVSQEIGFFDDEKNSVGALCARLSGDCSNVQGASGNRIGVIVQSLSTMMIGIILAFVYSWKLTLITLLVVPLILGAVFFEAWYMVGSAQDEKEAIEAASFMAVEAISNIRTVTSLGLERQVLERYSQRIDESNTACRKQIRFRGFVFALSQCAPLIAYGISIYYGGILVANEGVEYKNIIKVSEALIFGTWMLAQSLAFSSNVNAGIISAGRLLQLFDRVPALHNPSKQPFNTAEKTDGDIKYDSVEFSYPTRKEISVLKGFNLTIKRGTTVAIVGPSGSGKSTIVQLLLRYYDPVAGHVSLSGTPTTEFSFDTLRSQIGLVSQEPVLFDRTIAENIAYGDNFRNDIPLTEIIEVAKRSNIHDFIMNLPNGYETSLGSKGAQLSGGQKQRIAIARALVRNPKILVLDEATSALDMQSEKVVQAALVAAKYGRTCITIAHRLTTVRDSDVICVLHNGILVEQGHHDELMRLKGIYAELYRMQQVT